MKSPLSVNQMPGLQHSVQNMLIGSSVRIPGCVPLRDASDDATGLSCLIKIDQFFTTALSETGNSTIIREEGTYTQFWIQANSFRGGSFGFIIANPSRYHLLGTVHGHGRSSDRDRKSRRSRGEQGQDLQGAEQKDKQDYEGAKVLLEPVEASLNPVEASF